jgi:hypothetical protein
MMGNERRNTQFGLRHEFSYDNLGRIIEQKAYRSNDKLNWSKKFTNSSTGREIRTFDETGGFLARTVETFDKNGNVIESRILDMSGGVFLTARYTYEFDQSGNWIVRRSSTGGAMPAKTRKPGLTTFRTITYCD